MATPPARPAISLNFNTNFRIFLAPSHSALIIKQGSIGGPAALIDFAGGRTSMKRVGLWAIGIGVLASVGLLTVAPGFADNNGATKCSLKTLKGRYLFTSSGTIFPPTLGVTKPTLSTAAGYHIFYGDGTGIDYVTVRFDGQTVTLPPDNSVSYTLNADCTGTFTGVGGPHFDIFVSPNGDELTTINTDQGVAGLEGPDRRVAPK
jgi:hypothetical protein